MCDWTEDRKGRRLKGLRKVVVVKVVVVVVVVVVVGGGGGGGGGSKEIVFFIISWLVCIFMAGYCFALVCIYVQTGLRGRRCLMSGRSGISISSVSW